VESILGGITPFISNFRATPDCLTLKQRSICTSYLRYIHDEEIGADDWIQ